MKDTEENDSCSSYSRVSTTRFDHLPDLFFIDLFSYLSSIDVLWIFADLNHRFRELVNERGFFRHINLSSARLSTFDTHLALLPLTQIQTLVIDIGASSLQLIRWPHLPSLITLRLYGLRDFEDATSFILRHALSLSHLTLGTTDRFTSMGSTGNGVRPRGRLARLVENVLPHLTSLRSLDLGQDTGIGLASPQFTMIHSRLTYLRVSVQDLAHLYHVMSSKILSTTLKQFHVTMRRLDGLFGRRIPVDLERPPMMHLHTFTLVQTILSDSRTEWWIVESLTNANQMPILRQVNLAIFITVDDLNQINRSSLFTDHRQVDVQFAFMIDDASLGVHLTHQIPHGSHFHPREVVGVTCVASCFSAKHQHSNNVNCHYDGRRWTYDVWYTLPWMFEPLFDTSSPWGYITKTRVFTSPVSSTSIDHRSRLHTLTIAQDDCLPSIMSMPHVVQLDRIETAHLLFHDWPIGLNLPFLRHLTLTNNLVLLKSFSSFPPSIRSIQILLLPHMPKFISNDWSVLRSLPALPLLTSLHIVLRDLETGLDEDICQIIAEVVPLLVHFGICFRAESGRPIPPYEPPDHYVLNPADFDFDINNPADLADLTSLVYHGEEIDVEHVNSLFDMYQASIEELHRRILRLSFRTQPSIVVEEEGCGLDVWV